jgi:hypothetical protein
MSADKFSIFYCLTESGWQAVKDEHARVEKWVRIYELEVYQGSPIGRTSRHWRLVSTKPEFENEEAGRLEQLFPKPERELSPDTIKYLQEELAKSKKQAR